MQDFIEEIYSRFENKSPFATIIRIVLQRILLAQKMDELFNTTARKQYERNLLFSTLMTLMFEVVMRTSPSIHHAYRQHQDSIPVSFQSVYNKLNQLEPNISRELVRFSVRQLLSIRQELTRGKAGLLPGFKLRIIDGNHFSGTEHRLVGTRDIQASPLPGAALVILDPDNEMILDVIPCEDAHAQERSFFDQIVPLVGEGELWIADRNFATLGLLFNIADRQAFFLMRQHGSIKTWSEVGEEKYVGKTTTGWVYEQQIEVTNPQTNAKMTIRRIRIQLFEPSRDGETEIVLLTNLAEIKVSAPTCCELYRKRWSIAAAFWELTECFCCEVKT
jgi:hypothetical protein